MSTPPPSQAYFKEDSADGSAGDFSSDAIQRSNIPVAVVQPMSMELAEISTTAEGHPTLSENNVTISESITTSTIPTTSSEMITAAETATSSDQRTEPLLPVTDPSSTISIPAELNPTSSDSSTSTDSDSDDTVMKTGSDDTDNEPLQPNEPSPPAEESGSSSLSLSGRKKSITHAASVLMGQGVLTRRNARACKRARGITTRASSPEKTSPQRKQVAKRTTRRAAERTETTTSGAATRGAPTRKSGRGISIMAGSTKGKKKSSN